MSAAPFVAPWTAMRRYWAARQDERAAHRQVKAQYQARQDQAFLDQRVLNAYLAARGQVHARDPEALDALRKALDAGGTPNQPVSTDDTPLLSDAVFGDAPHSRSQTMDVHRALPPLVGLLLEFGADPNLTQNHGTAASPLISAARVKSLASVRALLAAGADVHGTVRETGATALHDAQPSEIVEALLAAGADPLARNAQGQVPLHTAYEPPAVRLLVRAMLAVGGDPETPDRNGRTPRQSLVQNVRPNRLPAMLLALEEAQLREVLEAVTMTNPTMAPPGSGRRRL